MRLIYNLFLSVVMMVTVMSVDAQTVKITILHTNDTHSRIEPLDKNDPYNPNLAGVVRRKALVDSIRAIERNVLVFDSGDFSQGSPYYSVFHGDVEIEMMNEIGYDAATFGNHEFDFGLDNLKRLTLMADFPMVCTNYDFSNTVLKDIVKPYYIINIDGVRIGLIGLGTRPEGMIQEKHYVGMKFIEPYEIAERTAAYLKKKKRCDIVICLSHLGMYCVGNNIHCDTDLIANTKSIDVVLGGHSHTYMKGPEFIKNAEGREIPVSQMGKNGNYVGRMDIYFEKGRNRR